MVHRSPQHAGYMSEETERKSDTLMNSRDCLQLPPNAITVAVPKKPLLPSRLTDICFPATTSEKAELVIAHLRRKNTQHESVQKL